jgi:hypothetical protein
MANTSPKHYGSTWEVGDFIRNQQLSFHLGNAVKYICRCGKKPGESSIQDLTKAIHYLQNELEYEILHQRSSQGIPEKFPGQQQYESSFTDYAADFDR